MKPRVIAVGGPTATGKTALGVLLAKAAGSQGIVVAVKSVKHLGEGGLVGGYGFKGRQEQV